MKKIFISLALAVFTLGTYLPQFAQAAHVDMTLDKSLYTTVLDRAYDILRNKPPMDEYDGDMGLQEAKITYPRKKEALNNMGFFLKDINEDGMRELFICYTDGKEKNPTSQNNIAIYTTMGARLSLLVEGGVRNAYYLLDDDSILNLGSNGAASQIVALYRLTDDGFICTDYYFSEPDEKDNYAVHYYHNTTGKFDTTSSEELDISQEDFENISNNLLAKRASVPVILFAEYRE